MNQKFYLLIPLLGILMTSCEDQTNPTTEASEDTTAQPDMLPFDTLSLDDMSAFQPAASNWQIAGKVFSDLNKEGHIQMDPGTGILVNAPDEQNRDNLATAFEHGDLELHFEVMIPKGSNSGVYFQGRYEVQLFDSWGKENPGYSDMGGLYQRWDETRQEGKQGFEGVAPAINASKAPGLWQHYHILFRAPKFDDAGNKTSPALFEYVYLNDMLLHENVELSGPTRAHQLNGEAAHGPLYLQGDHGPVAFRNIQYKTYEQDTLRLENLTYQIFEGKWDYIPDFDSMTPIGTGSLDLLDVSAITEQPEGYGAIFKGDLIVPTTGDYLFETIIDDGGDLIIDSTLVVHNLGDPGYGLERGIIHLEKGKHAFELTFYQEVWSAYALINYEGPQMHKRGLSQMTRRRSGNRDDEKVIVKVDKTPEMVRGFVMQSDRKLSHSISVGFPQGINYSYDLHTGALARAWKGGFADVTDMWHGRGQGQLLVPLNASIEFTDDVPVAHLKSNDEEWPPLPPDEFHYKGYRMNSDHLPIFQYEGTSFKLEDEIKPTDTKELNRTITFSGSHSDPLWYRIAESPSITLLENGLYSMDGQYYVSTKEDAKIRSSNGHDELLLEVPANSSPSLSYNILW